MDHARIRTIFDRLVTATLDTLFPIACLGCQKEGVWLCEDCERSIPQLKEQVCPICERLITPQGNTCFRCRNKLSIDGLLVASSYQDPLVARMTHLFKYRFISDLSLPLGKIILQAVAGSSLPLPDLLVPVPLHQQRLRWRGFNQSSLLAEYLQKNIAPGFPIPILESLLLRQKNTSPQMKMRSYGKRMQNVRNIFRLGKGRNEVRGKNVWLIDDIATTGATLSECSRLLKTAGASSVFGIVIARQKLKS